LHGHSTKYYEVYFPPAVRNILFTGAEMAENYTILTLINNNVKSIVRMWEGRTNTVAIVFMKSAYFNQYG
jgi:hypothetical protein